MKTLVPMILSVCLIGAVLTQANEIPKPGPEMQKLAANLCGEWTYSGRSQTTPLGSGGMVTGRMIVRRILNGFATEASYYHKGPDGETQSKEIAWYDAAAEKYYYTFISNNGYFEQAPFIITGDTASWEGTCVSDGKKYKIRGTDTGLSDGTGFIRKGEIFVDGKTWLTVEESKYVKVRASAADSAKVEQELKRLETEAWKAVVRHDFKTIDRILADEFIGIYDNDDQANDRIWTKEYLISVVESGKYVLTSIKYDDLKVRIDGNAAAVSGVTTTKETFDGQDLSGRFRFTSTWIKNPTGWHCVGDRAVRISNTAAKVSGTQKTIRNKAVMKRVFDEVFNAGNLDAIDEIYHKDFVSHDPYGSVSTGVEKHKDMVARVRRTIPDYHENLQSMIVEGDLIACRWISSGADRKSGNAWTRPCLSTYRFQDGKIIEQWLFFGSQSQ